MLKKNYSVYNEVLYILHFLLIIRKYADRDLNGSCASLILILNSLHLIFETFNAISFISYYIMPASKIYKNFKRFNSSELQREIHLP